MRERLGCYHKFQKIIDSPKLNIYHFVQDVIQFIQDFFIQKKPSCALQRGISRIDELLPAHIGVHANRDGGFLGNMLSKSAGHIKFRDVVHSDPGFSEHVLHHRGSGGLGP